MSMFFISSKIVWALIAPSSLLIICFIFALLCALLQFYKLSRNIFTFSTIIFLLVGATPLTDYAFYYWEKQYKTPKNLNYQDYQGVIVLGGAIDLSESAIQKRVILNDNFARITTLYSLHQQAPELDIIYSGGSGYLLNKTTLREGDLFKDDFLKMPNVAPEKVFSENQSMNTYENALYTRSLYISKFSKDWPNEKPWLLLTSAYHMPRAYAVFRHLGWNITAYPTPYRATPNFWRGFNAKFWDNWMKIDVLAREIIGTIAYKLTDKI